MKVISINGASQQLGSASKKRKAIDRQWHFQDTVRVVRSFFGGMTVSAIAARERVGLNFIEGLIRDHSRPEYPAYEIAFRLRRAS